MSFWATKPSIRHASRRQQGFTLLELMIVVVVVGVLASIAYPSYIEYVARGHRAQLKTQLQAAQHWMERYYSERYFYGNALNSEDPPAAFANQAFATSPPAGEGDARYTLAVTPNGGGQGYQITASRAGGMTDDPCGDPTVTHLGVKGLVEDSRGDRYDDDAAAVAACWR
ncbi:type IV pilin protein [Aquabacterium sp. UBA2148]|uniref:type IV pilin protein n=1 Tax=Aquabacterium sp. UBA2148 TaxID=1946042 RepID=UPI00257A633E|nr:type IV pilin protein [Aquabacterium sp. UBA2148]